jgi:NarL family two-component system sensor histidine kinase LiaS
MESITWSMKSDFADWPLGDEDGRHLSMFFREVLHNVCRHSDASRVSIRLARQGKELILEIGDNGRGIAQDILKLPSTLRAIRQRAARLGGKLDILSSPESSTKVVLSFVPKSPGSASSPTPYQEET